MQVNDHASTFLPAADGEHLIQGQLLRNIPGHSLWSQDKISIDIGMDTLVAAVLCVKPGGKRTFVGMPTMERLSTSSPFPCIAR